MTRWLFSGRCSAYVQYSVLTTILLGVSFSPVPARLVDDCWSRALPIPGRHQDCLNKFLNCFPVPEKSTSTTQRPSDYCVSIYNETGVFGLWASGGPVVGRRRALYGSVGGWNTQLDAKTSSCSLRAHTKVLCGDLRRRVSPGS